MSRGRSSLVLAATRESEKKWTVLSSCRLAFYACIYTVLITHTTASPGIFEENQNNLPTPLHTSMHVDTLVGSLENGLHYLYPESIYRYTYLPTHDIVKIRTCEDSPFTCMWVFWRLRLLIKARIEEGKLEGTRLTHIQTFLISFVKLARRSGKKETKKKRNLCECVCAHTHTHFIQCESKPTLRFKRKIYL